MKIIQSEIITNTVSQMCIEANCNLSCDMKRAINSAYENEKSDTGKDILKQTIENYTIAYKKQIPICQDTGMAVFFVDIGNEIYIQGDTITDAINKGIKDGYQKGYLRKSIVKDPLFRENTKDNTPGVIHYTFSKGDKLTITLIPKGFGSENMSAIKMFAPSDGVEAIKETVREKMELFGSVGKA